ncbi:hypothetical protein [Alistipes sp.]|uniref:hypothetical protein n=1 Tax=Alistipes sp. TaxID=1872444 RepID=UPI003AB4019D
MKNKVLTRIILTSALYGLTACSSDSDGGAPGGKTVNNLRFINRTFDIYTGEQALPDLYIYTAEGAVEPYTEENRHGLTWLTSVPSSVPVSADGIVSGEALGTSRVSARTPDKQKQTSQTINVLQSDMLDKPLTRSMLYTSGHMLSDNSVMQSFDLGADGYMYCSQVGRGTNNYNIVLVRKKADAAAYESRMLLPYAGHGNNIAVEQDGSDMYVWVGSYGTRGSAGDYTLSQTIARIKYTPGQMLRPSECHEHYWIPQRRNLQASLDPDNDIALFWCMNKGYTARYFYIYRLSEIKALPETSRQLSFALTWGGMNSPDAEVTETPTILVKDLSQAEPLATITMTGKSPLTVGTGGNQGHDVKNGKIYYYEGAGNNNDGAAASTATVTVIDFRGNLVSRHDVAAIADMGALAQQGLTTTGYMEPEGIKLYDGVLYCGFASRSTDDVRRAVVLQYNLKGE